MSGEDISILRGLKTFLLKLKDLNFLRLTKFIIISSPSKIKINLLSFRIQNITSFPM